MAGHTHEWIMEELAATANRLAERDLAIQELGAAIAKQGNEIASQGIEIARQGVEIERQGTEIHRDGNRIAAQARWTAVANIWVVGLIGFAGAALVGLQVWLAWAY